MRNKNIAIMILSALLASALSPHPALARNPYIVDDAGIADKGTVQSANWFSHSNQGEDLANTAWAYQLLNNLETTAQATRDIGNGNDNTLFTLQGKYQWHAASSWQSSFSSGLTYDTAQQAFSGAYAYVPVTFGLTPAINLNVNMGWQYSQPANQNYLTWGANAVFQVTKTISFTAEEFGKNSGLPGQQLGIGWQPVQPLMMDLVYGHDISGTNSQWLTTAIAFTF